MTMKVVPCHVRGPVLLLKLQPVSLTDELVSVSIMESLWGNAVLLPPGAAVLVLLFSVLAVNVVAPLSLKEGLWYVSIFVGQFGQRKESSNQDPVI